MRVFALASLAVISFPTACARAPVSRPEPRTNATPVAELKAQRSAPSEKDVLAFLAPREGETLVSDVPWPTPLTPADETLLERCTIAKEQALKKAVNLSFEEQLVVGMKAWDKVDKRCLDVDLEKQTKANAELKDMRAQSEMRSIAAADARSAACENGAKNPSRDGDFEPMLWDRVGWSCIAPAFDSNEKRMLELPAYSYGFTIDRELGTFEVRGYRELLILVTPASMKTELVLRGRLGAAVNDLPMYRAAPRP